MSIFKRGVISIILVLLFMGCSPKQSLEWIPFNWVGDTISGRYIEKAYIYIPVKIDNLPYDFTMQFDLGTSKTVFYQKALDSYLAEYPFLANKLVAFNGLENEVFRNIDLKMGTVMFEDIDVWNLKYFIDEIQKDSINPQRPKHIGTIAPDMFQDKILLIDYKLNRLAVSDSLPSEYKDLPAEKFEIVDGIIKLPFSINGKDYTLMFDTGSSPFQLVTSKEKALEIANPIITDSLSGPLWWGKEITFYGMEVIKPVKFGGKVLKSAKVYYDKERLWEKNVFDVYNVWGLTGNAYFFDNMVIIDYKNKLFRVNI